MLPDTVIVEPLVAAAAVITGIVSDCEKVAVSVAVSRPLEVCRLARE